MATPGDRDDAIPVQPTSATTEGASGDSPEEEERDSSVGTPAAVDSDADVVTDTLRDARTAAPEAWEDHLESVVDDAGDGTGQWWGDDDQSQALSDGAENVVRHLDEALVDAAQRSPSENGENNIWTGAEPSFSFSRTLAQRPSPIDLSMLSVQMANFLRSGVADANLSVLTDEALSRVDFGNTEGPDPSDYIPGLTNGRLSKVVETSVPIRRICLHLCMYFAVDKGEVKIVDKILNGSKGINMVNNELFCEDRETLDLLLQDWELGVANELSGRLSNARPLAVACGRGQLNVAKLLVERGAKLDSDLAYEFLDWAALEGRLDSVNWLVAQIGKVDAHLASTAVSVAVACFREETGIADNYLGIVRSLIASGADVNARDRSRHSPVHYAANKKDARMIRLLLEAGASVDVQDANGRTPLIAAIQAQCWDIVRLLLQAGCDVNCKSHTGESAILVICGESGRLELVMDLLSAGAMVDDGEALFAALKGKQYLVVLYMICAGRSSVDARSPIDQATALLVCVRQQEFDMVELLLRLGGNPNLENRLGTTALWAACFLGDEAVVRLLLHWGCDLDTLSVQLEILNPVTPCKVALIKGHNALAKLLLFFGSGVSASQVRRRDISDEGKALVQNWWSDLPRTLKDLCMLAVRQTLGHGLPNKVDSLGLPVSLKSFIMDGGV